tara:strand:+ start:2824 stop:4104 length:1281 start_codon:yes stop_codon:yes gene_type:complete
MCEFKKKFKILLIPDKFQRYDIIQIENIKNALSRTGIDSYIFKSNFNDDKIKDFLKDNSFDVVFAVNKGRPIGLNKQIRFISWFQDFYYDSDFLLEHYEKNDIVYFYTSPDSFGVSKKINCYSSTLYPGIDPLILSSDLDNISSDCDLVDKYQKLEFSICGYIPTPILTPFFELYFRNYNYNEGHFIDKHLLEWASNLTNKKDNKYRIDFWKEFIVDLQIIVESNYEPLSGDLKVKMIASKIKQRIRDNFKYINSEIFRQWIPFFSTEYARYLDRALLAKLLSKHSYQFALFGKGWSEILEFESFAGKHISDQKKLFEIYKKSKINLYNNTHGLGMHSKVFEIFANGGFLALPKYKKNFSLSGINEGFNENEHFVTFTSENFEDLIHNWLFNTKKRIEVAKNAREIVLDQHTWDKRVQKIINDLEL